MINANDVKRLREMTGAGMLDCKKALEETAGDIDKAVDYLREKGIAKAAKKAERIAAEGLCNVEVEGNNAVILEINSETDFVAKNEDFKELVNTITKILLNNDVNNLEDALKLSTGNGTIEELMIEKTATIGEKLSFRRFEKVVKNDKEAIGCYTHMGGKITSLVVIDGGNEEIAKDIAMQVAAMNPRYIRRENITEKEIEKEKAIIKEQVINEGKSGDVAEKMVDGRLNKFFFKETCLEEQAFIKDSSLTVKQFADKTQAIIVKMFRFEVGEGIEKREENFLDEVMKQIEG